MSGNFHVNTRLYKTLVASIALTRHLHNETTFQINHVTSKTAQSSEGDQFDWSFRNMIPQINDVMVLKISFCTRLSIVCNPVLFVTYTISLFSEYEICLVISILARHWQKRYRLWLLTLASE